MSSNDETSSLLTPPPSIASRPNARRLVEACELAEMSLAPSDGESSPFVLVIEMASLIYLGEYVHARHLWTRSRGLGDEEGKSEDTAHHQLQLLWNVARHCHQWATGISDSGDNMQVEDENASYSTLAMRALQSCIDSGMQPCSSYGKELLDVFRSKVNGGLHRSFSRIKLDDYRVRMNVDGDNIGNFGWIADPSSSAYLVPDPEWEMEYPDADDTNSEFIPKLTHDDVMVHQLLSNGDRIRQLSTAVMFMEQTKMNA